ncbi:MAG TPA: DUF6445 family protein [Burkholderiaceae bacterium]|nr:DUF6445 family protein [Burkholderiaceae bacterium]
MGESKRRAKAAAIGSEPPDSAGAYEVMIERGLALRKQGRRDEAESLFERANRAAPERPEAIHRLGVSMMERGAGAVGIPLLARAVALRPRDADFRLALGRALSAAGRFGDAAAEFREALHGVPDDAQAWRDLGALLLRTGPLDEAESAFARAAQLAPLRADVHEALAGLQYRRRAIVEAQASWRRAAELDATVPRRLRVGHAARSAPWADGLRPPAPDATPAEGLVRCDAAHPIVAQDLREACRARELRIVDDVLADPLGYRQRALGLDFGEFAGAPGVNFPGRQTAGQPCDGIMAYIARLLGRDVMWQSPDNGAFRVSGAASQARSDIHVDPPSPSGGTMMAGLLYLTLPQDCRGGTSFYRHRDSGWVRRPSDEDVRAAGYPSFEQFQRRWTAAAGVRGFDALVAERSRDWDWLFEIPLRFNRLAMYRGDYFHAVSEVFGSTPADSRLVQLFYFEVA